MNLIDEKCNIGELVDSKDGVLEPLVQDIELKIMFHTEPAPTICPYFHARALLLWRDQEEEWQTSHLHH